MCIFETEPSNLEIFYLPLISAFIDISN